MPQSVLSAIKSSQRVASGFAVPNIGRDLDISTAPPHDLFFYYVKVTDYAVLGQFGMGFVDLHQLFGRR